MSAGADDLDELRNGSLDGAPATLSYIKTFDKAEKP